MLEPLRRLRVVVEPTEHRVAMDVTWEGHIPAVAEPRQYMRSKGKVVFDTQRLAQTGCWSGTLSVGGTDLAVTPERCWGTRDRSWGVRPVGEPETDGIRQGELVLGGMWNYFPMQFDDHAIMYICHERDDGERPLVQAERVWVGSRPSASRTSAAPSTSTTSSRGRASSTAPCVRFPEAGIEITCTPLLANFVSIGTGYGIDADWRHGMYHGPEPVTQGLVLAVDEMQGHRAVRHRRPRRRVLLRRARRLRPARARLLRPLPPLRLDGRGAWGRPPTERTRRDAGCAPAPRMRECGMPDASSVLLERLQAAFDTVRPGADPVLRASDRADFQANGALALAKELGRPAA